MFVQVTGTSVSNKGARLMLDAIVAQTRWRFPSAKLTLGTDFPAPDRLAYGAWTCLTREIKPLGYRARLGLGIMPQAMKHNLGLVDPQHVDLILDASGFAYGDFWGADKLRRRVLNRLAGWKKPGKISVMLPQAFGPFTNPQLASLMPEALALFDLVFVRDRESMRHLNGLALDHPGIISAPDFTNLLKPQAPPQDSPYFDCALIIPNSKMLHGGNDERRRTYFAFLQKAALELAKKEHPAAFLIHEGRGDRDIAAAVNEMLDQPLPIIDIPSATETKAVIAQARLVISSRFHGLVSALSSGVPALACGWSHKYSELMADYGCREFSITLSSIDETAATIGKFVCQATSTELKMRIAEKARVQRTRSEQMWDAVEQLVSSKAAGA